MKHIRVCVKDCNYTAWSTLVISTYNCHLINTRILYQLAERLITS